MKPVYLLVIVAFLVYPAAAEIEGFDESYSESVVEIKGWGGEELNMGSGFVYESNYIVTNNHVVAPRNNPLGTIHVSFGEGEWKNAEIVGRDYDSDLAVLEMEEIPSEADELEIAEELPEKNQELLIIGNPHGQGKKTTIGEVSGLNHSVMTQEGVTIEDAVRIEASIRPGNSGGPMITQEGEVAGIISARQGPDTGFAVSPYTAQDVLPELLPEAS